MRVHLFALLLDGSYCTGEKKRPLLVLCAELPLDYPYGGVKKWAWVLEIQQKSGSSRSLPQCLLRIFFTDRGLANLGSLSGKSWTVDWQIVDRGLANLGPLSGKSWAVDWQIVDRGLANRGSFSGKSWTFDWQIVDR